MTHVNKTLSPAVLVGKCVIHWKIKPDFFVSHFTDVAANWNGFLARTKRFPLFIRHLTQNAHINTSFRLYKPYILPSL
jgi:hypothetical protein